MVTPTQFMLDCAHNRDTLFNQNTITVFVEDFLDKVKNYSWYSSAKIPQWYCNVNTIAAAFKAHFSYIKAHYREVVVVPNKDPIQAKQVINLKLQKSSHGSRKAHLLKQHLSAMVDHPTLKVHIPLVKHISAQVISSDESEDEMHRTINYPHVYPHWQSQPLTTLLHQADVEVAANISIQIGTQKKASTQLWNQPHSDKFNDNAPALPGLPQNCYDTKWLSNLPQCMCKQLKVKDFDYDFNCITASTLVGGHGQPMDVDDARIMHTATYH
ncbi:hypothetical protein V8B97DRAFT_1864766 [Scleroderma yunnanense]